MSGIVHKVKDAVTHHGSSTQEHHHTGTGSANAYDSTKSSNHGPHDNNITNAADPRIDSDHSHMTGTNNTVSGAPHPTTQSTATGPTSSTTTGPHTSNMANKADPHVDSDRSKESSNAVGSGRFDQDVHKDSIGGAGVIQGMGGSGGETTTKTFEQAQHDNVAGSSYNSKKTAGPHQSDLGNKVDPRVDSDLDGSKTIGSQRV
ncbi:hypothetical protein N7474_001243 [Penicillium riverlandense]|uniref:uncharacterized protein n=1 Tax=Penicillium riverlandense TaxID=1903569 RepID=UPI00254676BA|nr:uncharacterized protein N7474_001243 [Penicillium riverlandense]KAJ5832932.1 hypothetical protein N7474_001243 [Penicillium riverlandense]